MDDDATPVLVLGNLHPPMRFDTEAEADAWLAANGARHY